MGHLPAKYWDSNLPAAIHARISQNHTDFEDFSRDNQCAAMVMLVLAYVKTPGAEITSKKLTELIYKGDELYWHVRERSMEPNMNYLRMDEILYFFKYGHHTYKPNNVNNVNLLQKLEKINTMRELITNIELLLKHGLSIALWVRKYYYGIFKRVEEIDGKKVTKYSLFDSHPTFGVDIPSRTNDRAVILRFDHVTHLAGHILRTLDGKTYEQGNLDRMDAQLLFECTMFAFNIHVDPVLTDEAVEVLKVDNWYIDLNQPHSYEFVRKPVNQDSAALPVQEPEAELELELEPELEPGLEPKPDPEPMVVPPPRYKARSIGWGSRIRKKLCS